MLIPESTTDVVGFILGSLALAASYVVAKRNPVPTG
jgi:hypothetical protein